MHQRKATSNLSSKPQVEPRHRPECPSHRLGGTPRRLIREHLHDHVPLDALAARRRALAVPRSNSGRRAAAEGPLHDGMVGARREGLKTRASLAAPVAVKQQGPSTRSLT